MTRPDDNRADLLGRAVEAMRKAAVPDGPPDTLKASTVEALRTSESPPTTMRQNRRRELMFRVARYSGVTAVAVAIVVGLFFLTNGSSAVAFDEVLENIQKARSVTFVNKQKIGDQPEFKFRGFIQGSNFRMELPGRLVHIADFKRREALQLNLVNKTGRFLTLDEKMRKAFGNPLEELRDFDPADAKKVGEEKIDGEPVLVYESSKVDLLGMKGKGELKFWVDPDTKLPVKIRVAANTRQGRSDEDRPFDTVLTLDEFSWNKRLDPQMFSLEPPEGFKVTDE